MHSSKNYNENLVCFFSIFFWSSIDLVKWRLDVPNGTTQWCFCLQVQNYCCNLKITLKVMNISLHVQHIYSLWFQYLLINNQQHQYQVTSCSTLTLVPLKSWLNIVEKKVSKLERTSHILVNYDKRNHAITHLDLCMWNIAQLFDRKCLW